MNQSQSKDTISRGQLTAIGFVGLLSPIVRRVPGQLADISGRSCWLSVIVGAIPVLLLIPVYTRIRRRAGGLSGEDMVLGALGNVLGRIVLGLTGLWLIFYCGFHLSSGADRLISTVFPNARPVNFVVIMLVMGLIGALGELRALARSAMVFRPILLFAFILLFGIALAESDPGEWFPIIHQGVGNTLYGALPIINLFAFTVYLIFLEGEVFDGMSTRPVLLWTLSIAVIMLLLCMSVLGVLGLELTQKLSYPFFTVIRELTLFKVVERIEAVILGLWVFPDFILVSVLLRLAARLLARALGLQKPACCEETRFFSLKQSRWLVWLAAALAWLCSVLLGYDTFHLVDFSRKIIPAVNLVFSMILLPACIIIWLIKTRKQQDMS